MRINKYLAQAEIGSRRNVEKLVLEGKVKINNKVVTDLATQVLETDVVTVSNVAIKPQSKKRYIMLNKPREYVTTAKDQYKRATVLDLIDIEEKVYPVGRLDYHTEGLLILTNDGDFANQLIHPKSNIEKEYEVVFGGNFGEGKLKKLQSGMIIDGYKTTPAIVKEIKLIDKQRQRFKMNIIIFEGRNRQIRTMFEETKLKIYDLKRVRIGGLRLGDLEVGQFRDLTPIEINKLKDKK